MNKDAAGDCDSASVKGMLERKAAITSRDLAVDLATAARPATIRFDLGMRIAFSDRHMV